MTALAISLYLAAGCGFGITAALLADAADAVTSDIRLIIILCLVACPVAMVSAFVIVILFASPRK